MEKGCILPNSELQKLKKEGNVVLSSLARFCNSTEKEVLRVLELRNTPRDSKENWQFDSGYFKRRKKVGKKERDLQKAHPDLRKIQESLKERFAYIPTSLSVTGGRPGDSAEKNADIHRKNLYLITLDIKDAYPSINTHRVFKYLEGALSKPLSVRFPLLQDPQEKELFIRAITHLCVSGNELPQGAVTSTQIENIVMQGIDAAIEKRLPEIPASNIKYSRYADDIAVSFSSFSTLPILREKMEAFLAIIKSNNRDNIDSAMEEMSQSKFVITDAHERTIFNQYITQFKEIVTSHPQISKEKKVKYIGQINVLKRNIIHSGRRIYTIQEDLINVIGDQGWKVNTKKAKNRTPQSNSDREINGLLFDSKGERALSPRTMGQYMRLLKDMRDLRIDEIRRDDYYKPKFKELTASESIRKVQNICGGIYKRVEKVYGKDRVPNKMKDIYKELLRKWANYDERLFAHEEKKGLQETTATTFVEPKHPQVPQGDNEDDLPF